MRTQYDHKLLADAVRAGHSEAIFRKLKGEHGIAFDASRAEDPPSKTLRFVDMPKGSAPLALDGNPLAFDAPPAYAQAELVTVPSAGIPWFLANWVDPKVIAVLVSPMMAAVIAGETMKGDWLT